MCLSVPKIPLSHVDGLVHDLNTSGFGCIPNYLKPKDLARMQDFVTSAVVKANNQYVHFNGSESVHGTGLEELAASEEFRSLIHAVYEKGTGKAAKEEDFYQVLRCLARGQ